MQWGKSKRDVKPLLDEVSTSDDSFFFLASPSTSHLHQTQHDPSLPQRPVKFEKSGVSLALSSFFDEYGLCLVREVHQDDSLSTATPMNDLTLMKTKFNETLLLSSIDLKEFETSIVRDKDFRATDETQNLRVCRFVITQQLQGLDTGNIEGNCTADAVCDRDFEDVRNE